MFPSETTLLLVAQGWFTRLYGAAAGGVADAQKGASEVALRDPLLFNFLVVLDDPKCLSRDACRESVLSQMDAIGCHSYEFNVNVGAVEAKCGDKGDPSVAAKTSREALAALRAIPEAKAVSRNRQFSNIQPIEVPTTQDYNNYTLLPLPKTGEVGANFQVNGQQWGLDRINQIRGMDGSFDSCPSGGAGVEIYVLDSGCRDSHSELRGRTTRRSVYLKGGYFAYGEGSQGGADGLGHGTHTAGIAAGELINRHLRPHEGRASCLASVGGFAFVVQARGRAWRAGPR
jgi:hypothetical protein